MHSNHSGDSDTPMRIMVDRALALGINNMCFTEHYDPDYVYDQDSTPEGTFELDIESYKREYETIAAEYADRIRIGFGVELGFQPHLAAELTAYAESQPFDFIIGSSHLCHRKDPFYPYFFEGRTDKEAFLEYFESVLENIRTFTDYDVYGHLDYMVRYAPDADRNYFYRDYSDVLDEILHTLIDNGKGLEVNTKGLRCGLKSANPSEEILKRYKELGGEIITIGSDAHPVAELGYGLTQAEAILKRCGFRCYTVFRKRKPEFLSF